MVADSEIARVAIGAGFAPPSTGAVSGVFDSAATIAVAVAIAESGGNEQAHAVNAREDSRGLWQINVRAHPQYAMQNLYDPQTNARAAFAISGGGTNWKPWTTYTSGAYKAYLNRARAVVKAGGKIGIDTLLNPAGAAAAAGVGIAEGIWHTFTGWAEALTWILQPRNLARFGLIVGGGLLIGVGFYFVAQEAGKNPAVQSAVKAIATA